MKIVPRSILFPVKSQNRIPYLACGRGRGSFFIIAVLPQRPTTPQPVLVFLNKVVAVTVAAELRTTEYLLSGGGLAKPLVSLQT